MPHIRAAIDILTQCKRGPAAFQNQRSKSCKLSRLQRVPLCKRTGIFFKIVNGSQHSPVAAFAAQLRQRRPEFAFRHLSQNFFAQSPGHLLHLFPDGCKLACQFTVTAARIRNAQAHARRQQAVRMDLFDLRRCRICKVCKDDAAHRTGQLIQKSARLAKVGVFCVLADLRQFRRGKAAIVLPVPDDRHSHFKGRRAGKSGPAQHIAGSIGIKAAHLFSNGPEPLRNAADQTGGVGSLPFLRACYGQVNDIQFVEPTGLHPNIAVRIAGCDRHKVQCHRRRKAVTVLVVGMVAAQFCTARC